MYTERLSEALAIVACIDPDANGTGALESDVIDMRYHRRVMFIVQVGTMASTSTLDFKVQEGLESDMSDAADLSGKSITQLTQAGTDSDKQAIVEVTAEEVAAAGGRYIWGVMTIAAAASDSGMVAIADSSRFSPASEYDLASVDEIVA